MAPETAFQLVSEVLWMSILISAPVLIVTIVVGLGVSILQGVTQIQEASLTFIPKMVIAAVALVVFGPWMLRSLVSYASRVIQNIPLYL